MKSFNLQCFSTSATDTACAVRVVSVSDSALRHRNDMAAAVQKVTALISYCFSPGLIPFSSVRKMCWVAPCEKGNNHLVWEYIRKQRLNQFALFSQPACSSVLHSRGDYGITDLSQQLYSNVIWRSMAWQQCNIIGLQLNYTTSWWCDLFFILIHHSAMFCCLCQSDT